MTQYVLQSMIGQQVTFTSKNPTDATTYVGVIVGLITPTLAYTYGDITSYNAAVQKVDNTVGTISTLTFFLIQLSNNQSTPTIQVFSDAWISSGSFSVIQNAAMYSFTVFDMPNKGMFEIISVLQNAGYAAIQITDPTILALIEADNTVTVTQTGSASTTG